MWMRKHFLFTLTSGELLLFAEVRRDVSEGGDCPVQPQSGDAAGPDHHSLMWTYRCQHIRSREHHAKRRRRPKVWQRAVELCDEITNVWIRNCMMSFHLCLLRTWEGVSRTQLWLSHPHRNKRTVILDQWNDLTNWVKQIRWNWWWSRNE